jgi:hypothetical protein
MRGFCIGQRCCMAPSRMARPACRLQKKRIGPRNENGRFSLHSWPGSMKDLGKSKILYRLIIRISHVLSSYRGRINFPTIAVTPPARYARVRFQNCPWALAIPRERLQFWDAKSGGMRKLLSIVPLLLLAVAAFGQEFTQTIRGTVRDQESQMPLEGATMVLLSGDSVIGGARVATRSAPPMWAMNPRPSPISSSIRARRWCSQSHSPRL